MFSTPKCGHCGHTAFEAKVIEPSGSNLKQVAICCAGCSAVLGITDFYSVGNYPKQTADAVNLLQRQVAEMTRTLDRIMAEMRK